MSKTIVITGVTGAQGGSVARTFLQLPGWRVRGITRNPSGAAAKTLAARMSAVQPGHYTTNWRNFLKLAPQKQADGSFLMSRTAPPDFKMPFVVVERDIGAFVKALVDMPPGKDLLAVSEYMTFPEFAEVWGRVHGVQTTYKQISNEELFEGVPLGFMEEMRDGFDFMYEFGFTGGDPNVLEPSQLDSKIPVTSMEEYIRSEDWSPVVNA